MINHQTSYKQLFEGYDKSLPLLKVEFVQVQSGPLIQIQSEPLMFNRKLECMLRCELELLQLQRLKQTLENVYSRVPFYKTKLDEIGLRTDRLQSLNDLKHLPFTTKADLRDNYPFGLFAVPITEITRLHASSGTRGKPTVVGYTANDIQIWAEVCARSLAACGTLPTDVLHNSYGYGLFTGGLGLHYGAERLGATVVPASGGKTQQQIMLMQDFGARVLCCTPSYALNLAYNIEELGVPKNQIKLKIGVLGAEPWSEELRYQIEHALQIKAFDIYGLSEIIGPGVAMECSEGRSGLHIWEDYFLPEIIDPKTGEALEYGHEGELVFTSLMREGIPLIRYRTGDLSALHPEQCRCGRTMVRMNRIRGRLDDMLIIRGVNLYPSEIEQQLLKIPLLSPHYQLVVDRQKALDTLEVQVEITNEILAKWGVITDDHLEFNALTNKVMEQLKDTLGLSAKVTIMPPKTIPRSEGKAVRVIDMRSSH